MHAIYTIVAIAGDNGMTYTIGQFSTREAAQDRASRWQERDNPDYENEGLSYSVCRIQRISTWENDA